MKKYFSFVIISILAASIWGCKSSLTSSVPIKKDLSSAGKNIASSSEIFGLKLFKQVNKAAGDSNIFISPLSVSTAFGMVLNGANGQTYDQIKSTLELTGNTQNEINKAYQNVNDILIQADPDVIFESANSIWYSSGLTFEQSFIDVNKNYFNAMVQGLDFSNPSSADVINNWVSNNTHGKITKILQPPLDAIMYLINAIYFKGIWKYQFDKNATKEENFYISQRDTVKCQMMYQSNDLNCYLTNEYQAVELPYGNGDYSMIVILPSTNNNIDSLISQMDGSFWDSLLSKLSKQQINLWLPKFKIEYKILLNNVLQSMGMVLPFNRSADFTKMLRNGGAYISFVLQKTYVNVDEEGTEAAAVTVIGMKNTAFYENNMKVNRPFIFAIREKTTGTILFIGKIMNPFE